MWATRPAAWPALATREVLGESFEMFLSRLLPLDHRHPANPFIPRKRRETFPKLRYLWVGIECRPQVRRYPVERFGFGHRLRHRRGVIQHAYQAMIRPRLRS